MNPRPSFFSERTISICKELNVEPNAEIERLVRKADYVKSIEKSIEWEDSQPQVLNELKSKPLTEARAHELFDRLKSLDTKENSRAYQLMRSRTNASLWRIIVTLDVVDLQKSNTKRF